MDRPAEVDTKTSPTISLTLTLTLTLIGGGYQNLTNEQGEVTSHISGFLTRTLRLMEAGIKPVYVFDGKPPGADMSAFCLACRVSYRLRCDA